MSDGVYPEGHKALRDKIAARAQAEGLPLFSAGPEPAGDYKVPGLTDCAKVQRGDWVQVWAGAPRPLHGLQDREAVMRSLGMDPGDFKIHAPAPINKTGGKGWRTWWYAWPKNLTPYTERP